MMTCVASKLNASLETGFRMTYQFPLSSSNQNKTVVVDIADDEDVEVFMDMALKTTNGLVTLYVVESVSSRADQSDVGNNEGERVFTYQHLFPEHKTTNAAGTSRNLTQVLESEDEFGDERDFVRDQKESLYGAKEVNPLKHSGALDGDDDISWLMMSPPESTRTPRAPMPEKEAGGRAGKGILWWMNPPPPPPAPDISLKPPGSCKMEKDSFWGMPDPPLQDPRPSSDPTTPKLFKNKEALKLTLKMKCVEEGFKMKTTRSTKDRYEVKCVSDKCDWCISATRVQGTDMFQVNSFKVVHKC
ncbi:uncharacterized protein LOC118491379 [Helianthus annuus]|uniref:uncharacterized protein LOC118491379 n=1 Tax=Helianthus annuus TaxID=4232 RepID=UPI001652E23E|nr:uncharacterized protein LOC118491379 [Helianthus annuus]